MPAQDRAPRQLPIGRVDYLRVAEPRYSIGVPVEGMLDLLEGCRQRLSVIEHLSNQRFEVRLCTRLATTSPSSCTS